MSRRTPLRILGAASLYYAARARAYTSLDLVLEGDYPIEADAEIGFVPVTEKRACNRCPGVHVVTRVASAVPDAR